MNSESMVSNALGRGNHPESKWMARLCLLLVVGGVALAIAGIAAMVSLMLG